MMSADAPQNWASKLAALVGNAESTRSDWEMEVRFVKFPKGKPPEATFFRAGASPDNDYSFLFPDGEGEDDEPFGCYPSGLNLKVRKLDPRATLPRRQKEGDEGFDLYVLEDCTLDGPVNRVKTGIAVEIPDGYFGLIRDRSSAALKGLRVAAGTIDPNYRGELVLVVDSLTPGPYFLSAGDRVAQLLLLPSFPGSVEEADELSPTERGEKGFGSSGA